MPLLTNGPSRLLGRRATAASDWWLANNTIALANVAEHVENPTNGQLYAGGTLATAWTVSLRTNIPSFSDRGNAFDSQTGRVIIGIAVGDGSNGFYLASWNNIGLFATGDHTYMLVSDGANVQAYCDNVVKGSPVASANDIGGTTTWRSRYAGGADSPWVYVVRAGHVANIALDSTQRAALHTSMMALA